MPSTVLKKPPSLGSEADLQGPAATYDSVPLFMPGRGEDEGMYVWLQ